MHYYAALLPRRGPHIASHSVCPSVRPVIVAIGHDFSARASVTDVLFGTHGGPHIVRPSRPHRFLLHSLQSVNDNCLCVLVVTKTAKVSVSGLGLGLSLPGLGLSSLGLGLGLSGLGLGLPGLDNISAF